MYAYISGRRGQADHEVAPPVTKSIFNIMWPQPCQGSCLGYRLIASSSGHIIFSRKKVGKKIEISSRNGKTFEDPTDLSDEYFIFQRIFF